MSEPNVFVVLIEHLPAIITALAALIAVVKGGKILDDHNAIRAEQNLLRGRELGIREQEMKRSGSA